MNRVTQNTRQERIYGNMEAKVFLAVSWYELFFVADEFKLRPKEKEFVVLVISAYHSGINDYLSDKFKDYMSPNFTLSISDYMTRAKKKQWLQVSSIKKKIKIPAFFEDIDFSKDINLNIELCSQTESTSNY